jgi:exodeoxyribonuclease-5
MALTKHQTDVMNQGLNELEYSNRLVIKGSAGVGKTFLTDTLITEFMNKYPNSYKKILCSAPTNKAVAVLKSKITNRSKLEFSTTHSALKLKRNINKKTGDITFKPWFDEKYPPLKSIQLMVVDEASMINTEILKYIEEYATRFNVTVIFLGDEKQLNPVNEENSPVFHQGYPEVELTEIVRQGDGNPIIDLSRNIKDIWKGNANLIDDSHGYTYTVDRERIINSLAAVNGTDELKYLAWTNKEVDNMNFFVRRKIYGNPNKIELGETLVFNAPYGDKYFTNEEITVKTLDVVEKEQQVIIESNKITGEFNSIPVTFKLYIINEADEGGVKIIHEESDVDFNKLKKLMYKNCISKLLEWTRYFSFVESFGDLKYNHAITVHKSQGSTYQKTIVNVKNLNFNKNQSEKDRLFYTAVTRASELLILYNV